ncbi:MAG: hypothetical protein SPK06_00735, partial [Kiritimatiellia bacterium]|nr:hypothetical protein [Kiritimatiellia bacterium]
YAPAPTGSYLHPRDLPTDRSRSNPPSQPILAHLPPPFSTTFAPARIFGGETAIGFDLPRGFC